MNKTGIVIILLCFLAAAAVVLWERRKTRKTMEEIERMSGRCHDRLLF
ncbi:MAG: hypothetical protein ACLTAX_15715 [Waltera sp.]